MIEQRYVPSIFVPDEFASDDDPIDLCVLTEQNCLQNGNIGEWSIKRNLSPVPTAACLPLDFKAALLSAGVADWGQQEHMLLASLDAQLDSLLSCIYQGNFESEFDLEAMGEVPFVVAIGHSSGVTIAGRPVDEFAASLDRIGCEELILLSCRGGCDVAGSRLSQGTRIVVAPAR